MVCLVGVWTHDLPSHSADQRSPNWANQAAVERKDIIYIIDCSYDQ